MLSLGFFLRVNLQLHSRVFFTTTKQDILQHLKFAEICRYDDILLAEIRSWVISLYVFNAWFLNPGVTRESRVTPGLRESSVLYRLTPG